MGASVVQPRRKCPNAGAHRCAHGQRRKTASHASSCAALSKPVARSVVVSRKAAVSTSADPTNVLATAGRAKAEGFVGEMTAAVQQSAADGTPLPELRRGRGYPELLVEVHENKK